MPRAPAHLAQPTKPCRLPPLPEGEAAAPCTPHARHLLLPATQGLPFSLSLSHSRRLEGPSHFFLFWTPLPLSFSLDSRTRNPSRRPACPDVATQPLQPRHRVQKLRRRRLLRIPASIEAQRHRGRRPRQGFVAGHRSSGVKLSLARVFSSTVEPSIEFG